MGVNCYWLLQHVFVDWIDYMMYIWGICYKVLEHIQKGNNFAVAYTSGNNSNAKFRLMLLETSLTWIVSKHAASIGLNSNKVKLGRGLREGLIICPISAYPVTLYIIMMCHVEIII